MLDFAYLKKIPKTDLHVHLDGSVRIESLIEMAKEKGVKLPSYTKEGLKELVFKSSYTSLVEYLQGFSYTGAIMQDKECLERIAYELVYDNFQEGVRYLEMRFAPYLHVNKKLSIEDVLLAVHNGANRAKKEINATLTEDEPEMEYGLIVCAMRFCNEHFSKWYADFFAMHKFSEANEVIRLAALETVKAAVKIREEAGIPIVAFDLAGAESGYPADDFVEAFTYAHRHFMYKVVHAGEAYGPESIFSAITKTYADRIGHGLHLFDVDWIKNEDNKQKAEIYVERLANYIADRRIPIEVCLTSNLQTVPELQNNIKNHALLKMLTRRMAVTICTDNRLVSDTTICKEYQLMMQNLVVTEKMLKDIVIGGFKHSFLPRDYAEKRKYVRKVIDYYEKCK